MPPKVPITAPRDAPSSHRPGILKTPAPTCSFGAPVAVALSRSNFTASAPESPRPINVATAPDTRAVACDVPLPTTTSPFGYADKIPTPGADKTKPCPEFEKYACFRCLSTAPTLTTPGYAAGYANCVSCSLPAAATMTTP